VTARSRLSTPQLGEHTLGRQCAVGSTRWKRRRLWRRVVFGLELLFDVAGGWLKSPGRLVGYVVAVRCVADGVVDDES